MTVLVVEDTELLRRMYSDSLMQSGYRVISAADGLEALSMLRTDTPDLILMDLIMPKMGGLEVMELLSKDPRLSSIPVIILSNLGQDSDIQKGVSMGAVDYLIKNDVRPIDIAERVHSVLMVRGGQDADLTRYRISVRDYEGDADKLVADSGLTRRFWCPACEVELALEMLPASDRTGWYEAHFVCPMCSREY
ncbi:MAG: response regulator [Coriobacteriia bacterium]|nr:response regulator [Coriobacteriia bacterium]